MSELGNKLWPWPIANCARQTAHNRRDEAQKRRSVISRWACKRTAVEPILETNNKCGWYEYNYLRETDHQTHQRVVSTDHKAAAVSRESSRISTLVLFLYTPSRLASTITSRFACPLPKWKKSFCLPVGCGSRRAFPGLRQKRTQNTSLLTGAGSCELLVSEMTLARLATASTPASPAQERPMHKPSGPSLACSNMSTSWSRGAHGHHNN